MNRELDLRLYFGAEAMRIQVGGNLYAANAHLLSKVVIDCLRRYAMPAIEIDLSPVLDIDHVGVSAILDCERCALRRGVLFTLLGVPARLHRIMNEMGARDLLPRRPPPRRPQTGTICPPRRHR